MAVLPGQMSLYTYFATNCLSSFNFANSSSFPGDCFGKDLYRANFISIPLMVLTMSRAQVMGAPID